VWAIVQSLDDYEFDYYFDKSSIPLVIGDRLQYYFEVWDNDAIHGSKCTKSDVMQFAQLTTEGLDAAINQSNDQMQKTAQGAAQQSKQMQQEFKSLSNSLAQQGDTKSWEQQKSLQELSTKQEQLKVKVDQMKQAMDEQLEQLKQNNYNEALQEKQSDLQKQLKDALQKELEKQMQKMQELIQQKNTPLSQEALKDLEQENKLFAMDLLRLQALMKQLEHQIGLEQMAKKIDALAKEQEALKQLKAILH
jgi:methionine synthase I (cobalamin-dependent)